MEGRRLFIIADDGGETRGAEADYLLLSDGWLFVGRDFGENCWWR